MLFLLHTVLLASCFHVSNLMSYSVLSSTPDVGQSASAKGQLLKIATRQSPLALWQAEHVRARLMAQHAGLQVELVTFVTQGDRILDTPLAKIGGKGLFVKELENALLDGRADLAVHSMKDVPMQLPPGLILAVTCEREDPLDAFVSNHHDSFAALPTGAVVGTSSLRRRCQLLAARPDLQVVDLRGNVGTRLSKLDQGQYDAIILASAGLRRLGLATRIREQLEPQLSLPAVGQGALGLECRADDDQTLNWIACLNDPVTASCVRAERAFNAHLQGGCQVPIAAFAQLQGNTLHMEGRVGAPDGQPLLCAQRSGPADQPETLGIALAEQLLDMGAGPLLAALEQMTH